MNVSTIARRLVCECRPDFHYKNESSFRKHMSSQRHQLWDKDERIKDLTIRLKKSEHEILRLQMERDNIVCNYVPMVNQDQRITRSVSNKLKWKVISSQEYCCKYCNSKFGDIPPEIDHTVPLCKGGTNSIDNLQALCVTCHNSKTINQRKKKQTKQLDITTYVLKNQYE